MRLEPVKPEQVRHMLERAVSGKADTSSGVVGVDDVMRGAELLGVVVNGRILAACAISETSARGGKTLWVRAAGAVEHVDAVGAIMPEIMQIARTRGCVDVALMTARRGLEKQLSAAGFKRGAVVLRKGVVYE